MLHYPAISRRYLTISNHISLYLAISRISAISGTFTQPHPRDDAADSDAKSQKTRVIPGFPQQKLGYTRVFPEIIFGRTPPLGMVLHVSGGAGPPPGMMQHVREGSRPPPRDDAVPSDVPPPLGATSTCSSTQLTRSLINSCTIHATLTGYGIRDYGFIDY